MPGPVTTYYSKQVLVSLGDHALSSPADGDFITIESGADTVTHRVGAYGEVARSISPDESYAVKLTILYNSETMAWVQRRLEMDRNGEDGMFPFMMKDLRGGPIFESPYAWVVKPPSRGYSMEAPAYEIDIICANGKWTE